MSGIVGRYQSTKGPVKADLDRRHWLDVGEFLIAFAFAYDWLHDAWTSSERDYIMSSIIKFGLEKGASAYDRDEWFLSVNGNWNCA